MKLDLQIRDLKTGNRSPKAFESVDAARTWLEDRPKFTEVLGVASHHVPPEVSNELKTSCRPLDEEEKLLVRELDAAEEAALRKRASERLAKETAEAEKQREELATADPNRPMDLRFTFNAGLSVANPMDTRPITEEARAAAMEWVAERNTWVESRNQVVGDAKLHIYPGPLPDGVTERIVSGTFIPVTAPKKDDQDGHDG